MTRSQKASVAVYLTLSTTLTVLVLGTARHDKTLLTVMAVENLITVVIVAALIRLRYKRGTR